MIVLIHKPESGLKPENPENPQTRPTVLPMKHDLDLTMALSNQCFGS